jgi:hypothetical protein
MSSEGPALTGSLWSIAGSVKGSTRFWGMVAGFGALWGALEITVGTFLHALKLPFGGTAMAAVAVALLVAQRQLLPQRGLSLATGVVTAICKSVSPGGVILGPMIGITVEALLVELALLIAPRSRVGAFFAGALAICWATFQKVISHYVYFGGSILDLYVALVEQGARLLGLSPEGGWRLLGGLVLALMTAGGLVALWARGVGQQVARSAASGSEDEARP